MKKIIDHIPPFAVLASMVALAVHPGVIFLGAFVAALVHFGTERLIEARRELATFKAEAAKLQAAASAETERAIAAYHAEVAAAKDEMKKAADIVKSVTSSQKLQMRNPF